MTVYIWQVIPIITGFGAKILCSEFFVAGRSPDEVIKTELSSFLSYFASYSVDLKDSSASAAVFALGGRIAVYSMAEGAQVGRGRYSLP